MSALRSEREPLVSAGTAEFRDMAATKLPAAELPRK